MKMNLSVNLRNRRYFAIRRYRSEHLPGWNVSRI